MLDNLNCYRQQNLGGDTVSIEWNQDSGLEANFELHDQIMEGNLEGASCFLRGETDAQCATRWRNKAYAISKYARELIENNNKLREQVRSKNIQSCEDGVNNVEL